MASVNKVILVGNVGADPEIRSLPSGTKTAQISLATSENYTDKNGQKQTSTEWHRIELWDRLADIAEQYVKKGDALYIEGRIRSEKYIDQQGVERISFRIRGNALQMLTSRGGGNEGGSQQAATPMAAAPASRSSSTPDFGPSGGEDDLPF